MGLSSLAGGAAAEPELAAALDAVFAVLCDAGACCDGCDLAWGLDNERDCLGLGDRWWSLLCSMTGGRSMGPLSSTELYAAPLCAASTALSSASAVLLSNSCTVSCSWLNPLGKSAAHSSRSSSSKSGSSSSIAVMSALVLRFRLHRSPRLLCPSLL